MHDEVGIAAGWQRSTAVEWQRSAVARASRRRGRSGPWPVRPRVAPGAGGSARHPASGEGSTAGWVRRSTHQGGRPAGRASGPRAVAQALVVAVLTALVVIALGLLADASAAARTSSPAGAVVTHGDGFPNR